MGFRHHSHLFIIGMTGTKDVTQGHHRHQGGEAFSFIKAIMGITAIENITCITVIMGFRHHSHLATLGMTGTKDVTQGHHRHHIHHGNHGHHSHQEQQSPMPSWARGENLQGHKVFWLKIDRF